MNTIKRIRKRLDLSQAAFGEAIGVSQGTVSNIEVERHPVMPDVARRIIAVAAERGLAVTFDDIYGLPEQREANSPPSPPRPLTASGQGAGSSVSLTVEPGSIVDPVASGAMVRAGAQSVDILPSRLRDLVVQKSRGRP